MDSQDKMEEPEINLLELLHLLVKRKMFIVKICSFAVVAAVVYSLTLPNIYSATAKILPPQKDSGSGLSSLLGQAGGLAGLTVAGMGGEADLYIGILKSRSVADAVIKRADLSAGFKGRSLETARNEIAGAIKVQAGKDGIISISADDKDPNRAALLANAFVDELAKTTVRLNLSKAGTEKVFLEKRLDLVKKELMAAEDDLKAFSQLNKIVQVDSQASATIEGLARLKADLAGKEVLLSVLRSKQTEQSPEVKAMLAGIRRIQEQLRALSGSSGAGGGIPSIGNVPGVGLEYSRILRELKTQEAIFEQLTKQYEMVKINEAKDSSSLQVLDEAVVPINKSKPQRSLIVFLTAVSAFFGSVLLVFWLEYWSKLSEGNKLVLVNIKRDIMTFK